MFNLEGAEPVSIRRIAETVYDVLDRPRTSSTCHARQGDFAGRSVSAEKAVACWGGSRGCRSRTACARTSPGYIAAGGIARGAHPRGLMARGPRLMVLSAARLLLVPVGVALVHAGPSVVALGQWSACDRCRADGAGGAVPTSRALRSPSTTAPTLTAHRGVLDALDELGLRGHVLLPREPRRGRARARDGDRRPWSRGRAARLRARSPPRAIAALGAGRHRCRTLGALADCGVDAALVPAAVRSIERGTMYAARRTRARLVHWSAWGREWEAARRASEVADRVGHSLEPGAIVLLHDSDDTSPPGTVDRVVDALGAHRGRARRRAVSRRRQ